MNKFIIPGVLIILSIGLFVVYVDPTYKDIKDLKEVKLQYDEALNKSKELRKEREILFKSYNSFSEEDLIRIKKLLPDNVDNVRLVMDINSIASTYGAVIRNVVLNTPSSDDEVRTNIADVKDYDYVTLGFSMSATYENFIKFVTDLKDSLRLVDITHLSFSSSGEGEGSNIYKYNFTIRTYRLK